MFTLDYRIVHSEYDDFVGENGFLQIKCNECKYGEMYPKELETIMDKVSLYDWFDRLVRVVKNLLTKDYVALSDVESYNTWIEFHKKNEEIIISMPNSILNINHSHSFLYKTLMLHNHLKKHSMKYIQNHIETEIY